MTRRSLLALAFAPVIPAADRAALSRLSSLDTGKRLDALLALSKAAPSDRVYALELAFTYLQKTRESGDGSYVEQAAAISDRLLTADPDDLAANRLANELDMLRHQFRRVADRASRMLEVRSTDAGTWGNLGDALMELGEYRRAFEAYSNMLSIRAAAESYSRMAWYKFVNGDAQTAIALMQTGIAQGGKPEPVAWCHAELGDMLFKTGRIAAARRAYDDAIRLFPRLHRAHAGLGRWHESQGRPTAAVASYTRAASIVPMIEYHGALANLAGTPAEARTQWGMVEAIHKLEVARGEKTNRALAVLYADAGTNLAKALELAEAELANRNDVYTFDALGWVCFKLGRRREAREYSAKAVALNTPEPAFHFHAGAVALAAGRREEGVKHLKRCLELNPVYDRKQGALAARLLQTADGKGG